MLCDSLHDDLPRVFRSTYYPLRLYRLVVLMVVQGDEQQALLFSRGNDTSSSLRRVNNANSKCFPQ